MDLGDFLPTHTTTVGASMRFYLKGADKFSLFLQPGLALFYHRGYNVTENLNFISTTTYSGEEYAWFDFGTNYKTTNWRLERDINERASKVNLSAAATIGYRLTQRRNLTLDFGVTIGHNTKGVKNDIHYYGIKPNFITGFIQAGWKIW